jgi:hypothetical protein
VLGVALLTYEQLFARRHGVMIEGYYSIPTQTWTAGLAYRYHFRPGLGGFFVAPFVRFGVVQDDIKFKVDGQKISSHVRSPLGLAGASLGYRFQWKSGFNAVLRAGYGYQFYSNYDWTPSRPPNGDARAREALYGLDTEVSVGFSF